MNKEILAIIPARGGSKSIPNKNMKLLRGKPLIEYTIRSSKNSIFIRRIILSSDDNHIISYCRSRGIEVPFIRPERLARDDTPMLEVIVHALNFLKEKENYIPEYIILLQPTSPLRTSRHIDESLKTLLDSCTDSIVSVVEVPHNFNPYSAMEFDGKYLKPFLDFKESNNLRQKKPKFYARNGPAILAFTYDCLMNKKSMYGDKILPYFMKREESIDIDEEFDFKMAEYIMKQQVPLAVNQKN